MRLTDKEKITIVIIIIIIGFFFMYSHHNENIENVEKPENLSNDIQITSPIKLYVSPDDSKLSPIYVCDSELLKSCKGPEISKQCCVRFDLPVEIYTNVPDGVSDPRIGSLKLNLS